MAVQHITPTNGATLFYERIAPRPCGKSCEPSYKCESATAVISSLQCCTTSAGVP